ncbi:MAG TPA: acyltransferase [Iamia sp.]|nr:acyltransferase [Iamia sp.]
MTQPAPTASVPPAGDRRPLPYLPALDGLRAVAVVGVMLFHGGVAWMPGGFLGVDVFFVLSGYLITTLLLRERVGTGAIDLEQFWVRRLRRLLPALLVLVGAVGIAAPFLIEPTMRASVRGDGLAALGYVANWRFVVTEQSYFAGAPSPLRHLWSLAVEEQWYVLFPIVVALVLRRPQRIRAFVAGLAVATAASAAWMAVVASGEADPSRAYYGTDTRAHTLLVGALLAAVAAQWPLHRARRALTVAGVVGAALVVAAYLFVHEADGWMYQGGFLGLALATAALVAAIAVPRSELPVTRVLAARPLVAIGRVSYGLYLWHWPVDVALTPDRTGLDGTGWWVEPALLALRTAVTVVLTLASYWLVEQPVRRHGLDGLRLRFPGPLRSRPATVAVSAVVVVWLLVAGTARVPDGVSTGGTPQAVVDAEVGVPELDGTVTTVAAEEAEEVEEIGIPPVPEGRKVKAMVTGDSVAFTLTYAPTGVPPDVEMMGRAIIGCGVVDGTAIVAGRADPISDRCVGWQQYWQEGASANPPDVLALVFGAWEVYDYQRADGTRLVNGSPEMAAAIREGLESGVRAVLDIVPDVRIAMIGAPCMRPKDTQLGPTNPAAERADPVRLAWVNEQFRLFAESLGPRAAYYDLGDLLCPGGVFQEEIDGVEIRPDGFHYEPETTGPTWAWLGERIVELARTPVPADELRTLDPPVAGVAGG